MAQIRPSTPDGVAAAVAELLASRPGRVRLAVDGAPAAQPQDLADRIVSVLLPRPSLHIRAERFWRPAGQRFEDGRTNPDSWLDGWLDDGALEREVLIPFAANGSALPELRDARTDRSVRAAPVQLPATAVVIVSGSVLLGRGLPFDVTIHVRLSPGALARRTAPSDAWILPALARYGVERDPEGLADLVVRADDPRRPALVVPS